MYTMCDDLLQTLQFLDEEDSAQIFTVVKLLSNYWLMKDFARD